MTAIADIRKVVTLWRQTTPAIIVSAETAVMYEQQTGGVRCNQRQHEGWLIELPESDADVFDPSWWECNYNRRTAGDDEDWARMVRKIEAAFPVDGIVSEVTVIAHPDNEEAWVHVSLVHVSQGVLRGVLTWENCD